MKKLFIVIGFSFVNCLLPMKGEGIPLKQKKVDDTAMELTLLGKSKTHSNKQKRLVSCDDWPFLPFKEIKQGLKLLPQKSYKQVCKYKKPFLFSAVAVLPKDITRHIIFKMLDEDKKAVELFMRIPLVCAFQQYKKVKLECDNELRLKNRSAGMFFRMSLEERQMIQSFLRSSWQGQLFFDNNIAMTQEQLEEFNILDDDIQKEFIAGQEIIIKDKTADKIVSCLFSRKLITNAIASIVLYESVVGALYMGGMSRDVAMGLGVPAVFAMPLIFCFVAYVSVDYLKMSSKKIRV